MRIGLITGEYPPMRGGVADYTHTLAETFSDQGHKVFILTDRRGAGDQLPGVEVSPIVHHWGLRTLGTINRWARDRQLDIVNLQFETAAYQRSSAIQFWARALLGSQITRITTFHDLLPPYLFKGAGPLRDRMLWLMAGSSDGVVTTNGSDSARLLNNAHVAHNAAIPIGSNIGTSTPSGYSPGAWRQEHGIATDTYLIGYFGFMNADKGLSPLIEGAAQLVQDGLDTRLVLIGGGVTESDTGQRAYTRQIETQLAATGLGPHTLWTGFLTSEGVSAWLKTCDVLALPFLDGVSLRRGSFMAGIAHGCSIVTTTPAEPIAGLDQAAITVPPNDIPALAAALRNLSSDPVLRAQIGRNAIALSASYSWDQIASRMLDFYNSCAVR